MKEHQEPTPSWKSCVIFGIVNILLVLLCTKLHVILISASLILLLMCGVVVTAQFIKVDWKAGFRLSAVGCVIGFLLQCVAALLYVVNILSGFISLFT